jgi:hypothetical protein
MSDRRRNLADPAYEPSGEELQALATRAFASVSEARRAAMSKLRLAIAEERKRVLDELERTRAGGERTS